MEITISVGSGVHGGRELRSLHDWLSADRSVRRTARLVLASSGPPVPGAQGEVLDVLTLTLDTGFQAAQFALAVAQWRAVRPDRPTVTVRRSDGTSVSVSDASAEEAALLLGRLLDDEGRE
ncbi:hypothetical protein [Streptomyces sp. NPDC008092]|uniref:effector-associated constant component EACC1 n=1 Tax=Streptomyces sp. NPDC008092 TaxID=3364808 RepID=UPI0036E0CC42